MTKIKVNSTVNALLTEIKGSNKLDSAEWNTMDFLQTVDRRNGFSKSLNGFFSENNITIADIENAFRHGWELEYEFKVGDIVMNTNSNALVEVVKNGTVVHKAESWSSVDYVKNSREGKYILVCKAEDRHDI